MEIPEAFTDVTYRNELLGIIQDKINDHDRSHQIQIGPSEIGGCQAKVAWKVTMKVSDDRDGGWAAHKGTVLHAWLDQTFKGAQRFMPDGSQRFFSDLKLDPVVEEVNGGTLDLYDALWERVIDWKLPGDWSMDQVRNGKVSDSYFVQAMTYGYGLEMTGRPVRSVGIMWLPMCGDVLHQTARGAVLKLWNYDRQVAIDGLERVAAIKRLVDRVGLQEALQILPKKSDFCSSCPAFIGNKDRRATCPGITGKAVSKSIDPFA